MNRKDDCPKSIRTTTLWLFLSPNSSPLASQPESVARSAERTLIAGSVPAQESGSIVPFVKPVYVLNLRIVHIERRDVAPSRGCVCLYPVHITVSFREPAALSVLDEAIDCEGLDNLLKARV